MKYRPEIDGLRAVAVLPVMLFHAGFEAFQGGFVGVDIFFVISGYLITTIIIEERESGVFSLTRFYERRARRILPALLLVLTTCLLIAWLLLPPDSFSGFSESGLSTLGFVANLYFWRDSDYFSSAAELKPLLHTWSLSIEEQYYLLFPVVMAYWLSFRTRLIAALITIAAASFLLSILTTETSPSAAFYLLPTRAWELLAGSLTAILINRRYDEILSSRYANVLAMLGIGLIAASVFVYDSQTRFPGYAASVPVAATVLVLIFARNSNLVARLLSARPAVTIGLISYSAYLWHQPIFAFARHYSLEEPSKTMMSVLLVLSIGLSYVTWRLVERPARQVVTLPAPRMWALSAATSTVLAAVFLGGILSNGYTKARLSDAQESTLATASWSPERDRCHTRHANQEDPACTYGTAPARWAVVGDSHAVELAYALSLELGDHTGVRHHSKSGCAPTFTGPEAGSDCGRWTIAAINSVRSNAEIQDVILAYRLNYHLIGEPRFGETQFDSDPETMLARWQSLTRAANLLSREGKRVTVVLQAPEIPKHISNLVFRSGAGSQSEIPGVARDWWSRRSAFVIGRLADLDPSIVIVDPAEEFCSGLQCYSVLQGQALYFDDNHPSVGGARLIARRILDSRYVSDKK